MAFTRTNSGISNSARFLGAEIIIYTEGGNKSYSIEEVEEGNFSSKSIDIKFWGGLFKINNFGKRVKFRALGSKTASKHFRDKITSGSISNVAVAIDRDLDSITSDCHSSPMILYTKGYSWENDVFNEKTTAEQITSMLLDQELPEELSQTIIDSFADFKRVGSKLLKIELAFRNENKKFITELNGERFFNSKNPCINKSELIKLIHSKKAELSRPVRFNTDVNHLCPLQHNYGKLISSLAFNVISFTCKKYAGYKSIPKQLVEANMIERYLSGQNGQPDNYYTGIIQRLDTVS